MEHPLPGHDLGPGLLGSWPQAYLVASQQIPLWAGAALVLVSLPLSCPTAPNVWEALLGTPEKR